MGRIHTDLIVPDPSDPSNPWSIHVSDLASCLTQLDSNTRTGHYPHATHPQKLTIALDSGDSFAG